MKSFFFLITMKIAYMCRLFSQKYSMRIVTFAHKKKGVVFRGKPEYIHYDAYLDPSGGLSIGKDVVISTKVIILTHDWSILKRKRTNKNAFNPVVLKDNVFVGAGAIILPGSIIGSNCIIGGGAAIKGEIDDYSIMAGNPAQKIGDTRY